MQGIHTQNNGPGRIRTYDQTAMSVFPVRIHLLQLFMDYLLTACATYRRAGRDEPDLTVIVRAQNQLPLAVGIPPYRCTLCRAAEPLLNG
jgi:hypothetical protein